MPYDKMAMMAMIALKHHLGDSVIINSKGRWKIEWGAWFAVPEYLSKSAVGTYRYVFPERAPVQNILDREGGG